MNTRTMNRAVFRSLAATGLGLVALAAASLDAQPAAPQPATAPAGAGGAATTPATAPAATRPVAATKPTTAPPPPPPPPVVATAPLPSPKAVALAFAASVDKGDGDVARGLVAGNGDRARWVDATVGLAQALKRLDGAATARFGEAGRGVSRGQLHLVASLKALEQA